MSEQESEAFDRLLQQGLDTFDSQAILDLSRTGKRLDHLPRWLHDACDLMARRAREQGEVDQAVAVFLALETLAPQQRHRWRSTTRKMDDGSHLAPHLIELNCPEVDSWAKERGLWLNRRGLFALIDRWIRDPAGAEIAPIGWNTSDKLAGMAKGALIGLAVLRGDAAGPLQDATQAMEVSKFSIATGLVRVARRITDQQGSLAWGRWPARDATLAWIFDTCGTQTLLEASRLLGVPDDIHQQTVLPLVERVMRAPLEAGTAQVPQRTEGGRGMRL